MNRQQRLGHVSSTKQPPKLFVERQGEDKVRAEAQVVGDPSPHQDCRTLIAQTLIERIRVEDSGNERGKSDHLDETVKRTSVEARWSIHDASFDNVNGRSGGRSDETGDS